MTGGPSGRARLVGVVCVDEPACAAVASRLVAVPDGGRLRAPRDDPSAPVAMLPPADVRPRRPFSGPLFDAFEKLAGAGLEVASHDVQAVGAATRRRGDRAVVGLVVPVVCVGEPPARGRVLVPVADHVDLTLRGPLVGRWPAGRERVFPSMSGLYAPKTTRSLLVKKSTSLQRSADVASAEVSVELPSSPVAGPERHRVAASGSPGPAIYSASVVAGVADAFGLSAWERGQMRVIGLDWASADLVPAAVVAAYYGLSIAAVGVSSGPQSPPPG